MRLDSQWDRLRLADEPFFPIMLKKAIQLTEIERDIQRILLKVVESLSVNPKPTLRIAGGWVRDKLMGLVFYFNRNAMIWIFVLIT